MKKKSLAETHPHLLEEWDYEKNNLFQPNTITPNTITHAVRKKVWWKCKKGHSWNTYIFNRTCHNSACPYCSGNKVSLETSIQEKYPSLAKEWHPTRNPFGPEKTTPGSDKLFWWLCKEGHEWRARPLDRCRGGTGCPFCSGRFPTRENNFYEKAKKLAPYLLDEWDFQKNPNPKKFLFSAAKKVWWKCLKGHEWEGSLNSRTKNNRTKAENPRGCPYCSNRRVGYGNDLLTNQPDLCEEWDYEKNQLGPEQVIQGSNKKVWWKCSQGHSWKASITSRVRTKCGCPVCSGRKACPANNLLKKAPDLCREWDYEKNKLGPENYLPGSGKKVWWKCSEEHSWCAQINSRTKGIGCPKCACSTVSKISQRWLDSLGVPLQQRERRIGIGRKENYVVDGFIPAEKTADGIPKVFEFLGDFWHGNPAIYPANQKNPINNKTFGRLYKETMKRFQNLRRLGYEVIYIWEADFIKTSSPKKIPCPRKKLSVKT